MIQRKIKPFASLIEHKWIALAIFLLTSSICAVTFLLMPPSYEASAVVEIFPRYITNLENSQDTKIPVYQAFVQNQVYNIMSFEVSAKALSILNSTSIEDINEDAVEKLMKGLDVYHVNGTYKVVISLYDKQAEGLAEKVNSIIHAYIDNVNQEKFYGKDTIVDNLQKRKAELQSELHSLVSQKSQLVAKFGIIAFKDDLENPYDQAMLDSSKALNEAKQRRITAESRLKNMDTVMENIKNQNIDSLIENKLNEDEFLLSVKQVINEQMVRLVTSISSASEEHPGRVAVEKEIESMELRLAEIEKETKERIIKQIRNEQKEEAEREKIQIEEEVKLAQIQEAALQEELSRQKDSVTQQAMMFNAALNLKSRIEQNRIRLDAIERRLDFFRTEENAPGFVKISSLARQPDNPTFGKGIKILGAIFAIGMILCLGLPILIDFMNPWINTPAEIEQVLNLPILGWIMDKGKSKTFKHHAFYQDQVKRLAMKMHELKLKEQCSSFTITSVKPGGGSTTLLQEFSKELKSLGFKTLCVEANALSYQEHEHPTIGLQDYLNKTAHIEDIISKNSYGIDQIYLGHATEEKHLPLDQHFFKAVKNLDYDFVLYDSPPLLLTADAELLVRQSDATLLIIESGSTQIGEVKRSLKTLETISPKQVGFIMNKVKIKPNSGYFHEILKEFETGKKVS